MTKLSRRSLTTLALVAVPAALAIAPSAAVAKGKKVEFNLEGPINHSKDPGYAPTSHLCCFPTYIPTIQIEVKLKGKKVKKFNVNTYGLWGPCSGAEYSDGLSGHEIVNRPGERGGLKLKKNGTFSGTHTQYGGTDTSTLSGRILGKRTASGTVREVEVRQDIPPGGYAWGTCDSGTVSWTASRVPVLTDLKASYDSGLVYPAGL